MTTKSAALLADDFGRYILDLDTPAEKTFGRVFGCFTKLTAIIAFFLFFAILGKEIGIISKVLRLTGLIAVVFVFRYFRRQINCYYVVDLVGGQILYHFSALMMVSEDPVANLEDVAGVGVTYAGNDNYALMIGLNNGKLIRVSDYTNDWYSLDATLASLIDLLKIPGFPCANANKQVIAVENGSMVAKDAGMLNLSYLANSVSGTLMLLFLFPYFFGPGIIVVFLSLAIISGDGGEANDTNSLIKQSQYAAVDIDGKIINHVLPARKSAAAVAKPETRPKTEPESKAEKIEFVCAPDSNASGTIVAGRGIIGLVEIGEDMAAVYARFNQELPTMQAEVDRPQTPKKTYRKYVPPVTQRGYFLDRALSVVFTEDKQKVMRVSRIEIFDGIDLPYRTSDVIGPGASAKKLFDLGDGQGNLQGEEGWNIGRRIPNASFYQTGYIGGKSGFGVQFAGRGISFEFAGDDLRAIVVEAARK